MLLLGHNELRVGPVRILGTFEISHKILTPYTTKYAFDCHQFLCVSYDIFEL